MIKQVIQQDDGSVFIRDWATWSETSGVERAWPREDWQGSIGDWFRRSHQQRTSHQGGRVTFWVEV
jgi:hypothetical protein